MRETIDKMLEIGFIKDYCHGFVSNSDKRPNTEVYYSFRRFDDKIFNISLSEINEIGINAFKWWLLRSLKDVLVCNAFGNSSLWFPVWRQI